MVVVISEVFSVMIVLLILSMRVSAADDDQTGNDETGNDETVKCWFGASFLCEQICGLAVPANTSHASDPTSLSRPHFQGRLTICCTSAEMTDVCETSALHILIGWDFEHCFRSSTETYFSGEKLSVQATVMSAHSVRTRSSEGDDHAFAAFMVEPDLAIASSAQTATFVLCQVWSVCIFCHLDFLAQGSCHWRGGEALCKYNRSAVNEDVYKLMMLMELADTCGDTGEIPDCLPSTWVLQLHYLQAVNINTSAFDENKLNNTRKPNRILKTTHAELHALKRQKKSGKRDLGSVSDAFMSRNTFPCNARECHAHRLALYSHIQVFCLLVLIIVRSLLCSSDESEKKKQNCRWVASLNFRWNLPFDCVRLGNGHSCITREARHKDDTFLRHSSIQFDTSFPWPLKADTDTARPCWEGSKKTGVTDMSDCAPVSYFFFSMTRRRRMGPEVIEVRPQTRFLPDATRDPSIDMAATGYRLATLSILPASFPVSRIKLAAAGFYSRGHGDQLICYSCGFQHSGWEKKDNPFDIHRRSSLQCEHVLETDRHIAAYGGEQQQSQASGSQQQAPTSAAPPQEQAQAQAQASTDQRRPSASSSQPAEGDRETRQSSSPSRMPQPQASVATASPTSASFQIGSSSVTAASSSWTPGSRLEMGLAVYPNMSVLQHRRDTFSRWDESQCPPLDQVLLSGFFYAGYSDCVRCFYCGVGLKNWSGGDDIWQEHVRWRPMCGYLRAIKSDAYIQDVQRRLGIVPQTTQPSAGPNQPPAPSAAAAATSTTPPTPGTTSSTQRTPATTAQGRTTATTTTTTTTTISAPSSSRTCSSATSQSPSRSQADGGVTVALVGASDREVLAGLEMENRRLQQRFECRICRQARVDTLFLPCGHVICCEPCASTVRECLMCQETIRATARIYMN